jgi:iron-sulfur cluster assembly protein
MITVTELARQKIKQSLDKRGRGIGVTIGVRTTGCSGLAYTFEYLDDVDPKSAGKTYVFDSFSIFISDRHLPYFRDLEIDWVKQGLNEGFEFRNSAERDRCGCGESFRV